MGARTIIFLAVMLLLLLALLFSLLGHTNAMVDDGNGLTVGLWKTCFNDECQTIQTTEDETMSKLRVARAFFIMSHLLAVVSIAVTGLSAANVLKDKMASVAAAAVILVTWLFLTIGVSVATDVLSEYGSLGYSLILPWIGWCLLLLSAVLACASMAVGGGGK